MTNLDHFTAFRPPVRLRAIDPDVSSRTSRPQAKTDRSRCRTAAPRPETILPRARAGPERSGNAVRCVASVYTLARSARNSQSAPGSFIARRYCRGWPARQIRARGNHIITQGPPACERCSREIELPHQCVKRRHRPITLEDDIHRVGEQLAGNFEQLVNGIGYIMEMVVDPSRFPGCVSDIHTAGDMIVRTRASGNERSTPPDRSRIQAIRIEYGRRAEIGW